jgi:hypothetical protein
VCPLREFVRRSFAFSEKSFDRDRHHDCRPGGDHRLQSLAPAAGRRGGGATDAIPQLSRDAFACRARRDAIRLSLTLAGGAEWVIHRFRLSQPIRRRGRARGHHERAPQRRAGRSAAKRSCTIGVHQPGRGPDAQIRGASSTEREHRHHQRRHLYEPVVRPVSRVRPPTSTFGLTPSVLKPPRSLPATAPTLFACINCGRVRDCIPGAALPSREAAS